MGQELPTTDLAELILSSELGVDPELYEVKIAVRRTFDKLNAHLSSRLGTAGYSALLKRALSLAVRDFPWLATIDISENGDIDGLNDIPPHEPIWGGCVALLARLIELLDTFIGRTLTARVLRSAWPDAVPSDTSGGEGASAQLTDTAGEQGESNG
jgi:hypothetical protein